MFVNRRSELAFLDSILERNRPAEAQFLLMYGRRRVGKTVLLYHWAERSGVDHTYWTAEKEPAALQRRKLFARLLGVETSQATTFDSWADCWRAIAAFIGDRRHILVLDEFPYSVESDPAMLSALQHAWDHLFKQSRLVLVLCGSHVHIMETIQSHQSPLFGRFTAQWQLQPFRFSGLSDFLPHWSAEERVAGYATVGGIPAYLEWLDPRLSFVDNLQKVVLAPGSMFVAEPTFLLYDQVREPGTHLAILKAIGTGSHSLSEIADTTLVGKTHLSAYLARLREIRMVERRLPITVPRPQRRRARSGRYHLLDPYFRFYFRFISPYQDELVYLPETILPRIREGLRAFIGSTAFEDLCRQWVNVRGRAGRLPFPVDEVGSHWSRTVQVDVVGVNWTEHQILLGECKWGKGAINRSVIRELVENKTPKVLKSMPPKSEGWKVHYAFFARAGFTRAARMVAEEVGAELVDLERLDRDLAAVT